VARLVTSHVRYAVMRIERLGDCGRAGRCACRCGCHIESVIVEFVKVLRILVGEASSAGCPCNGEQSYVGMPTGATERKASSAGVGGSARAALDDLMSCIVR
jgi:hypothetical protein